MVFLHALSTWVHGRGLRPLQPPVSLPAAWRAQKVNDEPVKVFNLLFFINFFRKWAETLEKLRFFSSRPKQYFYLTHSACEYSEKLALKKNKYGNFKRLYLKSYSKFRVKTSVFRKFIQFSSKQSGFSSCSTHVGTRQGAPFPATQVSLPVASRVRRVKNIIEKY